MTEAEWLAVSVPLAAEVLWGLVFLPRAWRFFHRPGGWWAAPDETDDPPTLPADLAWREVFVLYHLPGVAVIDTAWKVLHLRHSLCSVVAAMLVTGGTYAVGLWLLSRHL